MSFSRAPLKRFNEHIGCAPPPGAYEIKPGDVKGTASFNKSERFRAIKAAAGAPSSPPSPSRSVFISPVRRTLSVDGLTEGSSGKRDRNGMTFEKKQSKLLEREIRSSVQQRGEQDRHSSASEEDVKKAEAKSLAAVREKTALSASVITSERQRAELKKVNEFSKNKVSADATKKRINSLTMESMEARNNSDVKNQELSSLQINTEGHLKALESDLQAARATISTLQDRNNDSEDLHQVTKSQNAELENENERLNGEIRESREEIKVLQEYLDAANDEIQDLRLKLQETTHENVVCSQTEKLKQLEMESEQRTGELQTTRDSSKLKEEEANQFQQESQTSKDALWEVEKRLEYQESELQSAQRSVVDTERQMKLARQEVEDSQATIRQQEAELARSREVSRRTERESDERVAHLEQKCVFSEEERSKAQEEGLRKVEESRNESNVLQQVKRDERKRQIQLEQEHAALAEESAREKALVDSSTGLVEQEREESEERMRQSKEEMEEVSGESAVMEEQEQKSQEALQSSQREKEQSETQSRDAVNPPEGSSDVAAMKEMHLAAMSELQEAYNNSQKKIEDVVTESESTKEALKEAKGRQRESEAEVGSVTCQSKGAMDKSVEEREEEINRLRGWTDEQQERSQAEAKAREESSRMLLEVQACLAQKEEEVKAAQASHAAQISSLQKESQTQMNEKEETQRCLEEQRSQSLTELQHEREKGQKSQEELSQQNEEITKQSHVEREEKVRIQVALEEVKVVFEVERNNHEQVRSEVLKLQAELEKLAEERRSSMSEVELKKEFSHALENQLGRTEQDRDQLQSRSDDVEQENVSLRTQLDHLREETSTSEHESDKQQQDRGGSREQVEASSQEKVTSQWEMEESRQELQRKLAEVQEKSSPRSEVEHWKKQYEESFAKVRPFQEQLNAFAAERDASLNEYGANQEELNKLADAYARLSGHQNQKQKIKHVMKLKDENISLKQEVSKLRSVVSRQKSDLEQSRAKLPGAPRRRFDPSKAFQHDKENIQIETNEPLKDGNHKE